jgi:hypothetical protein
MRDLEIGKPYQEGLNRIPEGIVFDFNQGGGFLRIVFDNPLDSEIKEVKQERINLGLFEKHGIIYFLIKFGRLSWMDAPYYVGLSKPYELQELTDEKKGYMVQIVLIDGMTGLVVALKLIELPHSMSIRLKELFENQRKTQIRDYESVLSQIYSRYDTVDLLKEAEKFLL